MPDAFYMYPSRIYPGSTLPIRSLASNPRFVFDVNNSLPRKSDHRLNGCQIRRCRAVISQHGYCQISAQSKYPHLPLNIKMYLKCVQPLAENRSFDQIHKLISPILLIPSTFELSLLQDVCSKKRSPVSIPSQFQSCNVVQQWHHGGHEPAIKKCQRQDSCNPSFKITQHDVGSV